MSFLSKIQAHYKVHYKVEAIEAKDLLSDKLTQLSCLYNEHVALLGEKKPSSVSRIIDYIKITYGQEAINELAKKSHKDLKLALRSYGLTVV